MRRITMILTALSPSSRRWARPRAPGPLPATSPTSRAPRGRRHLPLPHRDRRAAVLRSTSSCKEPWRRLHGQFRVTLGRASRRGCPSRQRRESSAGRRRAAGSYDLLPHGQVDDTPPCCTQTPSDRKFTINVSAAGVRGCSSRRTRLPDANIGQAYTAPGAHRLRTARVSSWTLAGGHAAPGPDARLERRHLGHADGERHVHASPCRRTASPNNDTKRLSIFVLAPLELQALDRQEARRARRGSTAKSLAQRAAHDRRQGGRRTRRRTRSRRRAPCRRASTLDPATGAITGTGTTAGTVSRRRSPSPTQAARRRRSSSRSRSCRCSTSSRARALPAGRVDRSTRRRSRSAARTREGAVSPEPGKIPPGLELNERRGRLRGRC